jgi:hypothetical protein
MRDLRAEDPEAPPLPFCWFLGGEILDEILG